MSWMQFIKMYFDKIWKKLEEEGFDENEAKNEISRRIPEIRNCYRKDNSDKVDYTELCVQIAHIYLFMHKHINLIGILLDKDEVKSLISNLNDIKLASFGGGNGIDLIGFISVKDKLQYYNNFEKCANWEILFNILIKLLDETGIMGLNIKDKCVFTEFNCLSCPVLDNFDFNIVLFMYSFSEMYKDIGFDIFLKRMLDKLNSDSLIIIVDNKAGIARTKSEVFRASSCEEVCYFESERGRRIDYDYPNELEPYFGYFRDEKGDRHWPAKSCIVEVTIWKKI